MCVFLLQSEENTPEKPGLVVTLPEDPPLLPPPGGDWKLNSDLQIVNVQINPSPINPFLPYPQLFSGTEYTITVTVTNNGPGTVAGKVAIKFDCYCNSNCGPGTKSHQYHLFVDDIGVGVNKDSNSIKITLDATGLYKFCFEVDPDDIYNETDESDLSNVWETTLEVI